MYLRFYQMALAMLMTLSGGLVLCILLSIGIDLSIFGLGEQLAFFSNRLNRFNYSYSVKSL